MTLVKKIASRTKTTVTVERAFIGPPSLVHLRHLKEERLERDVRRLERGPVQVRPYLRFDREAAEDAALHVALERRIDDHMMLDAEAHQRLYRRPRSEVGDEHAGRLAPRVFREGGIVRRFRH